MKKLSKGVLSLVIALSMLCCVLVGCNQNDDASKALNQGKHDDAYGEQSDNNSSEKSLSLTEISSTGEIPYSNILSWVVGERIVVTDTDLFPFKYNSKYGFSDATGKVVISDIYEDVRMFSENKAFVKENSKWKIIDTNGNELYTVPNKYCESLDKSTSTEIFFKNDKAILTYQTIRQFEDDGYLFSENYIYALIINEDMTTDEIKITTEEKLKYRIINTPEFAGIITYNLDSTRDPSKTGFDAYKNQVIYRLFDLSGKELWKVEVPYEALKEQKDAAIEYLRTIGDTLELAADSSKTIKAFFVKNGYMNIFDENLNWGLLNLKTGEIELECKYDFVGAYSNGLCNVCSYSKWGYVDIAGNNIIPTKYKSAQIFTENGGIVKTDEKSILVIDESGVTLADYGMITGTINSYDYGVINKDNIIIIWDEDSYYKLMNFDGEEILTSLLSSKSYPLIMTQNYIFTDDCMYKIER